MSCFNELGPRRGSVNHFFIKAYGMRLCITLYDTHTHIDLSHAVYVEGNIQYV